MSSIRIIAGAVILSLITSCSGRDVNNERSNMTVTIAPLKFIVDKISGNNLNVSILVPANTGPETYEPTPQQMIELSHSSLIFSTGLIDFETKLAEKLSANSKASVIDLSEGVENMAVLSGTCSHASHRHGGNGIDPHIWTSPRLIKKMAQVAYDKLQLLFPDSMSYKHNYMALLQELDSLDVEIANKVKNSNRKSFIIYHPALTYYANDYDIEQIVLEQDGKEPSVTHIKSIIDRAKQDGIKYVFYQNQFSCSTVESVAKEIGGEFVEIDPLREDLINNLRNITGLIIK